MNYAGHSETVANTEEQGKNIDSVRLESFETNVIKKEQVKTITIFKAKIYDITRETEK